MKMKYDKSYDPVLLQVKANKFKTIVAIYNSHKNYNSLDFPGGSAVKNLPCNIEGLDSIPGLERSHMPWGN